MKTLVMLSGGIDSTYVLVKLLRETDDEVFAHHVHLINFEDRHVAEAQTCRRLVEHLRTTIRGFHYTESAIDHRGFRFFGFDIISVGFEAGIVAHSYRIDRWTAGISGDDQMWPARNEQVRACVAANCFPLAPPEFFLLPRVGKHAEAEYLGPEILALTWACRKPVKDDAGYRPCGECRSCKSAAAARSSCGGTSVTVTAP